MSAPLLVQGDARALPLPDASVDLIVTSPPYFGQRDYRDAGGSLAGQIGAEPTPQAYVDALLAVTRECMRVLKPAGSLFVNLGDSYYSGRCAPGRTTVDAKSPGRTARREGASALDRPGLGIPPKSQLLLPERYRIGCVDELDLIARATIVWAKQNGLPESVTDRVRCSHEYVYHFTKSARYYSAVDEIREPHNPVSVARSTRRYDAGDMFSTGSANTLNPKQFCNPLGKLPGSVWTIPSQPLNVPDHVAHKRCCGRRKRKGCEDGLDHYAAFPFALVRPIILGWSPREVCTACGEGRRPVADRTKVPDRPGRVQHRSVDALLGGHGADGRAGSRFISTVRTTGYACACPDTTAPATPGIVLDPFGGTGSTGLVAAMHGRIGVSVDASWDYTGGIARWRVNDPHERARAAGLEPEKVSVIPRLAPGQGSLFDGTG